MQKFIVEVIEIVCVLVCAWWCFSMSGCKISFFNLLAPKMEHCAFLDFLVIVCVQGDDTKALHSHCHEQMLVFVFILKQMMLRKASEGKFPSPRSF
jgi:hypothetical protein